MRYLGLLLLLTGCIEPTARECLGSDDCPGEALCRLGRCHLTTPPPPLPPPGDMSGAWDAAVFDAAAPDSAPAPVACGPPPDPGELVINELLVSPPEGAAGDANQDGVRDAYDDEFVELVNASDATISLEGIQLLSAGRPKHRFGPGCLGPGQALLLFGGPRGEPAKMFGEVEGRVAQSRFGFGNAGGEVELRDARGRALVLFTYEQSPTRSYTLRPEVSGRAFAPHPGDRPLSPGTCADGAPLRTGCPVGE